MTEEHITLEDMVRKRHAGDAWIVMQELANSTGGNVSRHADMVALGVWPSQGYSIHGYEIKRSRGDVQKELNDPRKADAVGKYCDHWWLVVSDLKIIDGLIVPPTWGVLHPKQNVLRLHKKAPKLEAKEPTRGFVAAMVRNVTKSWVPKADHEALKEKQRATLLAELERDQKWRRDDAESERDRLRQRIEAFEAASGVTIDAWQAGRIGEAVRLVLDLQADKSKDRLERTINSFERTSEQHEMLAANAKRHANDLRRLLDDRDQQELKLDQPLQLAGLHG